MISRMNHGVVILSNRESDMIPPLLVFQSIVPLSARQCWVGFRSYVGTEVIDKRSTLRCAEETGALEYDRIYRRNIIPGRMHAPAPAGHAHVPERHHAVSRRARRDVCAPAATASDGVNGLERPGVGEGEGGCAGRAHIVHAHEAVEPARDEDLVRCTPGGRGGRRRDAIHGGGPRRVGVALLLLGRAQNDGRRWREAALRDGMDGERRVGRSAKRGKGFAKKRRPGTGIQIDHVEGGGGGHAGEIKKTGFAASRHGEEAVAGYGQRLD